MNFDLATIGGAVGILLAVGVVAKLSETGREQRKRRKNYGRVTSKARRPMVMLNVRTRGV